MTTAMVMVARVGDIPRGGGRVVEVGGRPIALFAAMDGGWFATANTCPHRGGPLAEGTLEGTVVTCPWHGWRWDVATGRSTNAPGVGIPCHRVSIEGENVCVSVSPR